MSNPSGRNAVLQSQNVSGWMRGFGTGVVYTLEGKFVASAVVAAAVFAAADAA